MGADIEGPRLLFYEDVVVSRVVPIALSASEGVDPAMASESRRIIARLLKGPCLRRVQVMGAISWIVDSLLYEEAVAVAEEDQRLRREEATHEQMEDDEEDGLDDQVWSPCVLELHGDGVLGALRWASGNDKRQPGGGVCGGYYRAVYLAARWQRPPPLTQ